MIVAGADPGAEGAVVFLDAETCRVQAVVEMPMSGRELRVRELAMDLVAALDGRRCGHLFIERQTPFAAAQRHIGATSAFSLGERYMAVRAIAAAYGWPYEIVPASVWKKHFAIAKDKRLALDAAGRLMPEDVGFWTVRRGYCTRAAAIGRAEAALIGLYGIRALGGIAPGEAA